MTKQDGDRSILTPVSLSASAQVSPNVIMAVQFFEMRAETDTSQAH